MKCVLCNVVDCGDNQFVCDTCLDYEEMFYEQEDATRDKGIRISQSAKDKQRNPVYK
jgi:hypothetical protein